MGQNEVSSSAKKDVKTRWVTGQGMYINPLETKVKDEL